MHPNKLFRVEDRHHLFAFVKERGFGTIVAQTGEGLRGVNVPFVTDTADNRLRFHCSRGNRLVETFGSECDVMIIVNGPDAYISPDWYEGENQVPTWNYVTVHMQGVCRPLPEDALPSQLDDLSAYFEARLAPKAPWTTGKMDPEIYERMRRHILPFEVEVSDIEGTWKLSQNKHGADHEGAVAGLEATGDTGSAAIAALMRERDA